MGVHNIREIIFLTGVGLIIGGLCVFGYQGFRWLQTGYWPPIEIRDLWLWLGFAEPSFTWPWVQQMALDVLSVLLNLIIATFGIFLSLLVFWRHRA